MEIYFIELGCLEVYVMCWLLGVLLWNLVLISFGDN